MLAIAKDAPNKLVTTYLEMTDASNFQPSFVTDLDVKIERMQTIDVDFYRFLYQQVGGQWCWRDRLLLSDEELQKVLSSADTVVNVLYLDGVPAGYVELYRHDTAIEIAYFGLRSKFMGRGLGKHLLSYGIEQAWRLGAERIWLHTCNLDGPHALSNYLKRGFSVVKVEEAPMPELYM